MEGMPFGISLPRVRRPPRTILLVLVGGFLVNLAVYGAASNQHRERSTAHLADDAAVLVDRLTDEIHHSVNRVAAMQGLYEASQEVTEDEFHAFVDRLGPGEGMAAIGFAPLVYADELSAFQSEVRERHPDYQLHELDASGRQVTLQPRDHYFPVRAARSFGDLPSGLGFDLASDPIRAAAIADARQRDEPVVSGFVTVPGDEASGDVKIFAKASGPDGRLVGVVFAVLQVDEYLEGLARDALDQSVRWNLTDITEREIRTASVRGVTQWTDVLEVGDRLWLLSIAVEEDHLVHEVASYRTILVLGLVATALAAVLSYVVRKSLAARRELGRMRELAVAKDRFLAGVSHELRTPLASVLGLSAVLAKDWRALPAAEVQDYLDLIEQEGTELADLVDDLMTIERVASGTLTVRLEEIDLDREVERVMSRMMVPEGKQVRKINDLGAAWADPLRVRQILRNLYGNALRHADNTVEITVHRQRDRVELSIGNDGPPISKEKHRRLFQPYLEGQAAGQPASIGLGLWISQTLAKIMGGELSYHYRQERSVFTLALPAHGGEADTTVGTGSQMSASARPGPNR